VTSSAEEYRHYARQCLELAPTFQDKEARMSLLGSAQAWSRLAHLALANRQIAAKKVGANKRVMRDRRTLPSRQRTYRYLHVRVDRLEDAISHFYKVINELRRDVSTLEKQLKPSADRHAA
jgi:uncharacterized protein YlxW (UPF0749 family)